MIWIPTTIIQNVPMLRMSSRSGSSMRRAILIRWAQLKKVELIEEKYEVIIPVCNRGDFLNYDDFGADLDLSVADVTPHEPGIIMNHFPSYFDLDSMHTILYLDVVYSYASENNEVLYGSLSEDDIWQWTEPPVIQYDFASPQ